VAAFENLDAFRQNQLWIDVGTALRPTNTEMTVREAGSALPPRPQSDRGQPRGKLRDALSLEDFRTDHCVHATGARPGLISRIWRPIQVELVREEFRGNEKATPFLAAIIWSRSAPSWNGLTRWSSNSSVPRRNEISHVCVRTDTLFMCIAGRSGCKSEFCQTSQKGHWPSTIDHSPREA
jgi:hypothetical protein